MLRKKKAMETDSQEIWLLDMSEQILKWLQLKYSMTNLDSILKSREITLRTKIRIKQSYGFFSSHVYMCELDHKEGWTPKNWSFQTVVLEKILESPLDSKEIKPVNPEGSQHWIFIGRSDAEAPILWPHDMKSWLTVKDPNAGKD